MDPKFSAATHYVTFPRNPKDAPLTGLYFKVDELNCGDVYQFRIRADNAGAGDGIPIGKYSEWSEEITMPEPPEEEEEEGDNMSIPTLKTEPTYVESDAEDEDDDSLVGFDVLDQELPTSRQPQRKDAVLLKSTGKNGQVAKQEAKGMQRRGGGQGNRSELALDPGSF